jgi:integrase
MYKYYSLKEIKNKYGKVVEYVVAESKTKKDRIEMVFTKRDGLYSGTDVIKYPFKIIRNELGIKARFYDLRGSFATTSLRNECEIKDIAEVLGHRRIETTEKYYISTTEKDKIQVSKCFENSLKIFNNII